MKRSQEVNLGPGERPIVQVPESIECHDRSGRHGIRRLLVTTALEETFIGMNHFDYQEPTIFDRTSEFLADQTVTVSLDLSQPWGRSSVSLEGAQFLQDPGKYSLLAFADLEFRVFRGLSLEVIGSSSLIRDQVFLPRRGAFPEEILVRRRQLATDYQHSLYLGISYTFGSIFNNVVNSRFAGSSGGVIRRF